jgi:hypothetical protein
MKTDRITRSATWWKAWVLLTGLGVTVIGWLALSADEPPPANGLMSSPLSVSAENSPGVRGQGTDRPRQGSAGIGTLPGMPEKPVFRAPVTRTRRT